MAVVTPLRIKTISAYHQLRGLNPPEHPLISLVDYSKIKRSHIDDEPALIFDFYLISVKRGVEGKMHYGQQSYDFDQGIMFFMAPNQVLKIEAIRNPATKLSGWMLMIHPDFFWKTPLAKKIRQYEYFDYSVKEALFLSEREEEVVNEIARKVQQE